MNNKKKKKINKDYKISSGNIFADLELPNAEELYLKAKAALERDNNAAAAAQIKEIKITPLITLPIIIKEEQDEAGEKFYVIALQELPDITFASSSLEKAQDKLRKFIIEAVDTFDFEYKPER